MSETNLVSTEAAPTPPRKRGGLSGMVLAELRQLAGELNIPNISGMRKGDLIAAIKEKQGAPPGRKRSADAQPTLPGTGEQDAAPKAEASGASGARPWARSSRRSSNGSKSRRPRRAWTASSSAPVAA